MHEFALACEIWQRVQRATASHPEARVTHITLQVGELTLIEDEQLQFWVGALAERDGSPDLRLRITHTPAAVHCRACGIQTKSLLSPREPGQYTLPMFTCPACGSEEVEVTGGRELRVVSAEITPAPSSGTTEATLS